MREREKRGVSPSPSPIDGLKKAFFSITHLFCFFSRPPLCSSPAAPRARSRPRSLPRRPAPGEGPARRGRCGGSARGKTGASTPIGRIGIECHRCILLLLPWERPAAAPQSRASSEKERDREYAPSREKERKETKQQQFPGGLLFPRVLDGENPTCNFLTLSLLFAKKLSLFLFSPSPSVLPSNMLSSAASSGGAPSRLERLKRWYRSETIDPVKRSCNLVRRMDGGRERERGS